MGHNRFKTENLISIIYDHTYWKDCAAVEAAAGGGEPAAGRRHARRENFKLAQPAQGCEGGVGNPIWWTTNQQAERERLAAVGACGVVAGGGGRAAGGTAGDQGG